MSDDITSKTDAAFLRRMADNIEKYGWYVIKVMEEGDFPAFAYTIGLFNSLLIHKGLSSAFHSTRCTACSTRLGRR